MKADPTCPPCAWAAQRHRVRFTKIVSDKVVIPLCHQYMPKSPIEEILPDGVWGIEAKMARQIVDHLIGDVLMQGAKPCTNLTGVPMNADENSANWLINSLKEIKLRPAQWAALIEWLSFEATMSRARDASALLRLSQGYVVEFSKRVF